MSEAVAIVIGAIIGALGVIVAEVIRKPKKQKKDSNPNSIRYVKADEELFNKLSSVQCVYMYSVNSYALYNYTNAYLEQNPDVTIDKIILIVRRKKNESKTDVDALNQLIGNWHRLVVKSRIKSLKIIGNPHDINHYYTIMGDDLVFSGMVYHDDRLPSKTNVDYTPLLVTKESELGRTIIKRYKEHFDHTVEMFEKYYTYYDSADPLIFHPNFVPDSV